MKLYIIQGVTWEYESGDHWHVAAYLDKQQAEIHLQRLRDEIKRLKVRDDDEPIGQLRYGWRNSFKTAIAYLRKTLDPEITGIYDHGMRYELVEVTLYDHFDEFQELHNSEMIQEAKK